jgi:hypothetical protein
MLASQTGHLSVYTRSGEKTDAAGIERKVVALARTLGLADIPQADYYHYDVATDLVAVTGTYAGGVTYPARAEVHSTRRARDHELVHLVAYQLGDPGPFFQEGLAVVLGDRGRYLGRPVDDVARPSARRAPLLALIHAFDSDQPGQGYAIAGSFMKWLVGRFGLARVTGFFRAARSQEPANAFDSVFGVSLEEAGTEWSRQL